MAKKQFISQRPAPDKNSPAYLLQQYSMARNNLLLSLLFTLINLALYWFGGGTYFLFSIAAPYYGVLFGDLLGFARAAAIFAVVVLVLYFLCWLLSKQRRGWLLVATVLFALDCVSLLGLMALSGSYADMIMDVLFHIWVMFYLARGIRCGRKLKQFPVDLTNPGASGPEPQVVHNVGPEIGGTPEVKNRGPEID